MSSFNKFPWTNLHGFNLDWVIETVKSYVSKVDELSEEISDISNTYETKDNITNNRKLSTIGDFTGTLCNSQKTACEVVTEIDNNTSQIEFITEQFEHGATGVVVNCGFFVDNDIQDSYNGGAW